MPTKTYLIKLFATANSIFTWGAMIADLMNKQIAWEPWIMANFSFNVCRQSNEFVNGRMKKVCPTLHVFFQRVEIKYFEVFRLFEVVRLPLFGKNFRILYVC